MAHKQQQCWSLSTLKHCEIVSVIVNVIVSVCLCLYLHEGQWCQTIHGHGSYSLWPSKLQQCFPAIGPYYSVTIDKLGETACDSPSPPPCQSQSVCNKIMTWLSHSSMFFTVEQTTAFHSSTCYYQCFVRVVTERCGVCGSNWCPPWNRLSGILTKLFASKFECSVYQVNLFQQCVLAAI